MSEDFRKRGVAAFAREFGLCWGAVIGATLGLALIMAGITAPLDEAEEWWQWLISVPLGLAVVVLGCALAAGSGGLLFNRIALGWYGGWTVLMTCPSGVSAPSRTHFGGPSRADLGESGASFRLPAVSTTAFMLSGAFSNSGEQAQAR